MPGTVVTVAVGTGDQVEAGDTVLTVEAMKMEHRLVAPISGRVQVRVAPGDLVKLDQLVATVEAHPEAEDSTTDGPPTTAGRATATPTRSTVA